MTEEKQVLWQELKNYGWRDSAGWFRQLKVIGFTDFEIEEIEEEDNARIDFRTGKYHELKLETNRLLRELRDEVKKSDPAFWQKCLDDRIRKTEARISELYEEYRKNRKSGGNYFSRRIILPVITSEEKKLKRLRWERYCDEATAGGITGQDIEMARQVPLAEIVGQPEGTFILCPFHKEKTPSFRIYENGGYCFSCRVYSDSIRFIMNRDKLNFVQAVKKLRRRNEN